MVSNQALSSWSSRPQGSDGLATCTSTVDDEEKPSVRTQSLNPGQGENLPEVTRPLHCPAAAPSVWWSASYSVNAAATTRSLMASGQH
ncbi:hypothetical protein ElyMa_004064100 [Elysia marginata]|uniref:Uncharacterized protein n=1 Tax=Elysia marginata TaxID=1093978 RepID=A0AAV4G7A1_9GAST|nr:hypothetical protein ElyMa_004064100 [Elysia marginata]